MEVVEGYQGNGFRVFDRNNNYDGLRQNIDGATLNHSAYIGKVFVKAEGDQDQTFEMMVNWRNKSDESNKFRKVWKKLFDSIFFFDVSSFPIKTTRLDNDITW